MTHKGLVKSRLDRMHQVLTGHVERGHIPGIVALVSRHDDVHVDVLGNLHADRNERLSRDAIFRIASITKPVAAVATMILIEECKLRLDDSIEPWLPELANRRVLKSIASEVDDTVPARRSITVRDVLSYRMGFGSVMAMPDTYPIQRYIREYRLGGDGPPRPAKAPTTNEWIQRLGSLPLMAHPGERWLYNTSGDVLGILVERVSGKSFGTFLRERIFEPLGMKDTAFNVPASEFHRMPTCYAFNHAANKLDVYDPSGPESSWAPSPPFESGAGGLVSTVDDYFAFTRMMLNQGRLGREQILSRASVELMTSDQLTPQQREGAELFFGTASSWGLGLGVCIHREEIYRKPGRFGWDGGTGTSAYVDPAEGLIGILLTQRMMDSPEPPRVFTDFWTQAYAAME
ncbi:serine hydrolase domain-containing protein [Peristeroidobacter soli]|jgi:CubicO group peptidase (beta-lactamase class C family)|uniref:serine hydrolase domain-containing protein n=1 Tax=Peristeroidobacter soli TaxID=2497877 RepID=UPI00101B6FFE|nr:serine hydrolase domain-containing protein [Peristeroidobacter soli]